MRRYVWPGMVFLIAMLLGIALLARPVPQERPATAAQESPLPTTAVPPTRVAQVSPVDTRAKECVRVQNWISTRPTAISALPTPTVAPTPSATPSPTWTPTPGPTPDGVFRRARVPIVMYHHIDDPPASAGRIRYNLSTPPQLFEDQLRMLKEQGYNVITLDDLVYYLTRGRPLPPKPVILTFDDGYVDNYTQAFPLLKKYGFVGTFFIITDVVNQKHPDYLTWDMVREMRDAGMRFGAHGRTHIDLSQADHDQLVWQALGSTEVFQVELGEPARYIAYPSGRYDQEVIDVYKSAHYWAGLTTRQGVMQDSDHLFELKRIRVYHDTTGAQLQYLLEMDWGEENDGS